MCAVYPHYQLKYLVCLFNNVTKSENAQKLQLVFAMSEKTKTGFFSLVV